MPDRSTEKFLATCATLTDTALSQRLPAESREPSRLHEAMRYSVLGGGKRIRPALSMAAAVAVGGRPEQALIPACALELIHAYSLIHDDLPAMDDDDLRRGRPTTHIEFDEATAILAGDALQAMAFDWLASEESLDASTRLAMVQLLAKASGSAGMVGGQAIDLAAVGHRLTLEQLEQMHRCKTGALIEASVRMGVLSVVGTGGRDMEQAMELDRYAGAIGLAFQVRDDLLDVEGATSVIGKPQGSDQARAKPTFPALMGVDGARTYLATLLAQCQENLAGFGPEADTLRGMAEFVVSRRY
ncbi:farnesyl-diphosphate synthase [Marinobacter daqiaonensis]|uniref:Farnesyl-diphosphate synthase n=1 Tax=Marinobacter daqiaonensis TaxID=650891 RepID=A0A1I6J3H6_9GAMM|nr:farnesyl diphosphate synthase [Marinobacter daqiaonensis]SFR73575.1 farnesyl-diphosphate synthase [Marinobacter daqiaonensis]